VPLLVPIKKSADVAGCGDFAAKSLLLLVKSAKYADKQAFLVDGGPAVLVYHGGVGVYHGGVGVYHGGVGEYHGGVGVYHGGVGVYHGGVGVYHGGVGVYHNGVGVYHNGVGVYHNGGALDKKRGVEYSIHRRGQPR
jgi:hypothetical protein